MLDHIDDMCLLVAIIAYYWCHTIRTYTPTVDTYVLRHTRVLFANAYEDVQNISIENEKEKQNDNN